MKENIEKLYLIYFNDFLTIAKFAEYYNLTELKATRIINTGRKINNKRG